MAKAPAATAAQTSYLNELVAHGHLIPSGVPGLYGKSGAFEDIVDGINRLVTSLGREDQATVMRFPPAINRVHFERSDYLKSFPQFAGTVHSFDGSDRDHLELLRRLEQGEDWTAGLPRTDVVLTPAACYPIYPALAGTLPERGRVVDVFTWCFRHEPSGDPARMQMFRQREHVCLATPELVLAWRNRWFDRAREFIDRVQLAAKVEVANDPFFGRGGKMLAINQRDQQLKFEVLVAITSEEQPTACISLNYHQDHFGHAFGIHSADGAQCHTSCIGFGVERLTLALLKTHGLDPDRWPSPVRSALGL
jgi:seryl-tRNA synthetase